MLLTFLASPRSRTSSVSGGDMAVAATPLASPEIASIISRSTGIHARTAAIACHSDRLRAAGTREALPNGYRFSHHASDSHCRHRSASCRHLQPDSPETRDGQTRRFPRRAEWRVTVPRYGHGPAKNLHFREGVRLVPYLKLRFDPSAIAFVYVGPGGNFHDKRALRAILDAKGFDLDRVWIEHSDAPFRGD